MAFVTDAGTYNRRAVMREAHRVHRMMQGRGWTFAEALRFVWGRAREMRDLRQRELAAFQRWQRAALPPNHHGALALRA